MASNTFFPGKGLALRQRTKVVNDGREDCYEDFGRMQNATRTSLNADVKISLDRSELCCDKVAAKEDENIMYCIKFEAHIKLEKHGDGECSHESTLLWSNDGCEEQKHEVVDPIPCVMDGKDSSHGNIKEDGGEVPAMKRTADEVLACARNELGKALQPIISHLCLSDKLTDRDNYESCLKQMRHSKNIQRCVVFLEYSSPQELRYEIRHILSLLRWGKKCVPNLDPHVTYDRVKKITTFLYGVEATLIRNRRTDLATMICKHVDMMRELEEEAATLC